MKKKASAVVTVFLSLTLLMIMSILFVLLESARSEGLRLRAQMIANSAVESAFASYDKHLFDKYGLLYFAGKDSSANEFSDVVLEYAKKNDGDGDMENSWLSLSSEDVDVLNYVLATDDNGNVFIRSVCDYMKGAGIAESVVSTVSDAFAYDTSDVTNSDGEVDMDKVKKNVQDTESNVSDSEKAEEGSEIKVENEEELKKKYEDSKNNLKAWAGKGVLSLVCDNAKDISDAKYSLDNAPSSLSDGEKSRKSADLEEVSVTDKLLFDQYVFDNLNSYRKDSSSRLELEYLICGKENDVSNLSGIAKRIVAIRFGIDYVKTRQDATRVGEAYAIGVAVAGWTGIPSLVTAVKECVLVIWSLADAIDDTKQIFAGEKDDKGLSYEDYLRAFLLLTSSSNKSYRAMDVIQWKITEEEQAFRFKNCIYGARICVNLTSEKLFPLLPAKLDYSFSMQTAYSYGTVKAYR